MPSKAANRSQRRKRGVTILDVARRAGVSLGTVSNVLNERGNVSAKRRGKVQAAIAALHYVPNGLAQSLRRQRSRVVGLCAPRTSSAYFAALLDAFEDIAAAEGYEVMQVLSRHDPTLELRRVRALVARKVDGLILIPCATPEPTFDFIAAAGVPAVIVDRLSDDARFDYVTLDDYEAMSAVTQALLEKGHRRLLFVVRYPDLVTTRLRIAAFRAITATKRARGEVCVREVADAGFASQFHAIMAQPDRPTAVIGSNSALTLIILRVLHEAGIACPREVSLITFDDPPWAEVITPPLAVVRPPTEQIAHKAWELLLRRMHKPTHATERVSLHAEIELRASVARAKPQPARPRVAGGAASTIT